MALPTSYQQRRYNQFTEDAGGNVAVRTVGAGLAATATSTPSIASAATALAANTARTSWHIQNQGTNPLFVRRGAGATTLIYDYVLAACQVAGDGSGGMQGENGSGVVYTGIITVAGTTPSYVAVETE